MKKKHVGENIKIKAKKINTIHKNTHNIYVHSVVQETINNNFCLLTPNYCLLIVTRVD